MTAILLVQSCHLCRQFLMSKAVNKEKLGLKQKPEERCNEVVEAVAASIFLRAGLDGVGEAEHP